MCPTIHTLLAYVMCVESTDDDKLLFVGSFCLQGFSCAWLRMCFRVAIACESVCLSVCANVCAWETVWMRAASCLSAADT
mmetsp:Transcript_23761/g.58775  ORF Transcript_23761/g.58775 Transcript_23761/m.58775 type:complete len:80 (+) Transcript_23761:1213-1452(+)